MNCMDHLNDDYKIVEIDYSLMRYFKIKEDRGYPLI